MVVHCFVVVVVERIGTADSFGYYRPNFAVVGSQCSKMGWVAYFGRVVEHVVVGALDVVGHVVGHVGVVDGVVDGVVEIGLVAQIA